MSERDDSSCLNLEQFVHWFFSSDSLDDTVMATIVSHGTTRTGSGVERGVGQTNYCGGSRSRRMEQSMASSKG